jgi:NTE family protein
MAHHAGVLRALAEHGFDPATADLVIGTSAGAVMGAVLRSGHSVDELWAAGQGAEVEGFPSSGAGRSIQRGWRTRTGLLRRTIGSGFVLARTATRFPPMFVPRPLAAFWRGGLASSTEMRGALSGWLADEWPEQPTWLVSVDIASGRRIVAGRNGAPEGLSLVDAVRASAAVPGLYPPVRWGRRILVDGGAHSVTNAELASTGPDRAETVVIVAPMAYDLDDRPQLAQQVVRSTATRRVHVEADQLRRRGHRVIVLVPSSVEIAHHGFELIRDDDHSRIAQLAYERASARLAQVVPPGRERIHAVH